MASDRGAEQLALVRELERQDEDVAARLAAADDVLGRVDAVCVEVERIRSGLEAMPAEIAHAERDERDAREREAAARDEHEDASRELERVSRATRSSAQEREQAERTLRRAESALADAAAGVARHRERIEALVREEAALQAARDGLAVVARAVAAAVDGVPRLSTAGRVEPGSSLVEIGAWGAWAHASLLVVRGSLETERERLVYEANGLAVAVLGDQGAVGVSLVRRRLEEYLDAG